MAEEALRELDPRQVARQPTGLLEPHTRPASDNYSSSHLAPALWAREWQKRHERILAWLRYADEVPAVESIITLSVRAGSMYVAQCASTSDLALSPTSGSDARPLIGYNRQTG